VAILSLVFANVKFRDVPTGQDGARYFVIRMQGGYQRAVFTETVPFLCQTLLPHAKQPPLYVTASLSVISRASGHVDEPRRVTKWEIVPCHSK
jgi:hypothetical protein